MIEKSAPKSVLIFTAWKSAKRMDRFRNRILHHKQYTDRHGYKYAVYITGNDTSADSEFTIIHAANNFGKRHSPGWLKVFAFKHFFNLYPDIEYFVVDQCPQNRVKRSSILLKLLVYNVNQTIKAAVIKGDRSSKLAGVFYGAAQPSCFCVCTLINLSGCHHGA